MFCRSETDCRLCAGMHIAGKWLHNQETSLRQANMENDRKTYSFHLIFTFYFYRDISELELFPSVVF